MTAIEDIQKDLDRIGDDLGDSVVKEVEQLGGPSTSSDDDFDMDDVTDEEEVRNNTTLLEDAASLKESGNAKLKEAAYVEAVADYQAGLDKLKRRGHADKDEKHKTLEMQLNSNLALACLKAELFFDGTQAATHVLEKEPSNIKALLRRGVCHSKLGNFEEAKRDLTNVLGLDASNIDAKKELNALRPRILEAEKKQKAAFSGFFAKTGGTLYSEKEAELRKPKNLPEQPPAPRTSPAKESASTQSGETESKKTVSPAKVETQTSSKTVTTVEGVDLDEEDLRILEETKKKGYCYFRRELTAEEKALRETQHVPQKLDANSPGGGSEVAPSPSQIKGVSEWNAKGTTYEEKDTTQWCQKMLTSMLKDVRWESESCSSSVDEMMADPSKFMKVIEAVKGGMTDTAQSSTQLAGLMEQINPMRIMITKEPEIKGEAQVMVVRGSKRHFYEYKVKLQWRAELLPSLTGQERRSFTGSLSIEDFSSTVQDDDLMREIKIYRNTSQPDGATISDTDKQLLDICYSNLKKELARQREEFFKIYRDRQ